MRARRQRRANNSAQIVRILHAIQQNNQSRLLRIFVRARNNIFQRRRRPRRSDRHHALMVARARAAIHLRTILKSYRHAVAPRELHNLVDARVLPPFCDQHMFERTPRFQRLAHRVNARNLIHESNSVSSPLKRAKPLPFRLTVRSPLRLPSQFEVSAMRKTFLALFLCVFVSSYHPASAQDTKATLTGRWLVTADFHGTPLYFKLELTERNDKLSGNFDGDKLEGTATGTSIKFVAKGEHGGSEKVSAILRGMSMSGTAIFIDSDNPDHAESHEFTAALVPPRPTGPAKHHEFVPTIFYRQFSPLNKAVLTIAPGDSVHTTTVDAGGTDEKGVTRVLGGNPETGPFYVESAVPGDTLVVHIIRLRLQRDWAMRYDYIVDHGMDRDMAVKAKDDGKNVRWHLDTAKGAASPEKPGEHLAHYSVPLRPMLGCV